jgi:hypothetical protein
MFRGYILDWICGEKVLNDQLAVESYIKSYIAVTINNYIKNNPESDIKKSTQEINNLLISTFPNLSIEEMIISNNLKNQSIGGVIININCSFLIKNKPLVIQYIGMHEQ